MAGSRVIPRETEYEQFFRERRSFWIRTHQLDWEEAEAYAVQEADKWLQERLRGERAAHHRLAGDELDASELV